MHTKLVLLLLSSMADSLIMASALQYKALCMCGNMKKMCRRFELSMAMGLGTIRATPRRNPNREKTASKEHYRWMLLCFNAVEDTVLCGRTNKLKVVAIWAPCKLCKFKSPGCGPYGVKTRTRNFVLQIFICRIQVLQHIIGCDLEEHNIKVVFAFTPMEGVDFMYLQKPSTTYEVVRTCLYMIGITLPCLASFIGMYIFLQTKLSLEGLFGDPRCMSFMK